MFPSASAGSSERECDDSKVWTPPRRSYEKRHLRPSAVSSAWDASNVWIPPRRSYETSHLCPPLAEDGWFIIPIPPFKPEDMERYRRQVHESEGFDVDWIPGMEELTTYIRPSPFPEIYVPELLAAIDEFNQLRQAEGRPSISLVRVIKVNSTVYPRHLWCTLVAKDVPGGTERTYQAKVYAGHKRVRSLIFLREKPSPDAQALRLHHASLPMPITAHTQASGPPVKDAHYYKSLIQLHGGNKPDPLDRNPMPLSDLGNQLDYHHNMSSMSNGGDPIGVGGLNPSDMKPKVPKPCAYFNTPRGCRHGSSCLFQHDTSATPQRIEQHKGTTKRIKLDGGIAGYKFDEHEGDSAHLRLQFARFPGPRSGGGPRGRH